MAKPGLRKIGRYSESFKLTAVKLSFQPDVAVKSVAEALDIHPFMLSRWRKQHREEVMRRKVPVDEETAKQLRELKQIKRDYARLQEEHELLKKAIRFSSEQKAKSLSSSKPRGKGIGSK
jgi:transposase